MTQNPVQYAIKVCSFRRKPKTDFSPEIQQISQSQGTQNLTKVCNLGNLANTFEKAASKQLVPFLLVDQAQRSDTGHVEKFRLSKSWTGIFESALKNELNESIYDCKNYYNQAKYKSEFHIHQEVPLTFNFMKVKVKRDHCRKFSNLSNWKEEA